MKKLSLMLMMLFAAVALYAQNSVIQVEAAPRNAQGPKFKWEETTFDFGKIKKDVPVTHNFVFTNTGTAPLVISRVQGSCGCTVTSYTDTPIAPGKTGFVKAVFNAAAMGAFHKSISVSANVEGGMERLFIKGEVVSAEVN